MRKGTILCVPILMMGLMVTPAHGDDAKADPNVEETAVRVASAWLELIDSGKYAEGYDTAAEYFKQAIKKDAFEASLKAVRTPLGKKVTRTLKSKKFTRTLPSAPDGQYVVIQFETSFENKKSAVETITPMLDKDGKWRVSGYYIK